MNEKNIKIGDKEYTLAMNRESIKWLEANGFSLDDLGRKPVTCYELLWISLFRANHKDVNPNLAIKLMETYQSSGEKPGNIVKFAIDEYNSFLSALADIDLEENKQKTTNN